MAKRASNYSVDEIEGEIEKMKAEGARTERWMSAWSRKRMTELEKRDVSLRDAFEAGYRTAVDRNFIMWLIYGAAAFSTGALFEFLTVSYP